MQHQVPRQPLARRGNLGGIFVSSLWYCTVKLLHHSGTWGQGRFFCGKDFVVCFGVWSSIYIWSKPVCLETALEMLSVGDNAKHNPLGDANPFTTVQPLRASASQLYRNEALLCTYSNWCQNLVAPLRMGQAQVCPQKHFQAVRRPWLTCSLKALDAVGHPLHWKAEGDQVSPEGRAALQVGWDTAGGQPPPASRRAWWAGVCVFGLVWCQAVWRCSWGLDGSNSTCTATRQGKAVLPQGWRGAGSLDIVFQ